jgi:hypothetical protein
VLLLRLPFGRPRPRDVEGAVSGTLTPSLFPSGTLSPLEVKPLGDDMDRLGSRREGSSLEEKWGMPRAVKHARYLKRSGEGVTPDVSVTDFCVVCQRSGCRSGSWEELMGHVANVCQPTSHDDSGSYGGGDSKVKMTRLATGTLRRPPRGNKTRSGASSQEAARRLVVASRAASWDRLVSRRPGELRKTQPQ